MKIASMIILFIAALLMGACNEDDYGYLDTRNIGYMPDTVVFKAVLNPEIEEDARMIEFEIPWQSSSLQGVQGTAPILYFISGIVPDNGVTPEILSQFRLTGKGIIELPWNHTVPTGRYVFSIKVEAGSHVYIAENILTVIVEDPGDDNNNNQI